MNRIDRMFKELRKKRKKALIVYITAGYPDMVATKKLIATLEKSGADLIELGIPFSDPLADGPTIQRSSQEALLKGSNLRAIFKTARAARKETDAPIVFMTYYNPVLHYGPARFVKDSRASGVDGVIIPDLPPEEAGEILSIAKKENFSIVFLAAPTSTDDRLKNIAAKSSGFIYYVSLTGVTGARKKLPSDIVAHVRKLKGMTKKPVCVGFGISEPAQAKKIAAFADGVIVGSAVIRVIEKNKGKAALYKKVAAFTKSLSKAVHG